MNNRTLLSAAIAAIILPLSALAHYTTTVNGIEWTYTVSDGKASVGGGDYYDARAVPTSTTGAITIPSRLGGYPVTYIGDYAFDDCSGLTSVTIGNGVTRIGNDAFQNCQSLRSLKIPRSVESIGSGVFSGCDSRLFDTTSLPGVKLVDGWCVGWYTGLSGALNLKGARGIAVEAFRYCGITSVTIPGTVKIISRRAFCYCNLETATLGYGVKRIDDAAFDWCSDLTSVTIPNSVTSIGSGVFYACDDLTTVVIPSSVRSVADDAFSGSYLEKIYIHRDFPGNIANDLWGAPSHCLAIFYSRIFVFDQQGGTGGQSHVPVSSATTPASVTRPKRTGYIFTGYWTGPKGTGTKIYGANGKKVRNWSGGASAVLYAGWTRSKFNIAFKANGGKGKMAKQNVTYGKAVKLNANKFTRKGWIFLGWAKSKSGAVVYKNKASIKGLASETNITLYAKWAKKTYKVAFYANGGKGRMKAQAFIYGKAKKLTANKFKRKGYTFKGWAKSAALATQGKVAYKNKKSVKNLVTNGKTVKLYAVWKKK